MRIVRAPHALTRLAACWLSVAAFALAAAEPVHYALDPVHTRVQFAVSHAGFSQAIGTVAGTTGALVFDPDDWTTARLNASVPLERLELGDAKWNQAARAANLLDAADHPAITFVSTRIEPISAQHATVHGMLTLRGVTREVALDVVLNAVKRHPMPPFRRTAGFSATATLSRKAFGMDAWPTVIGDAVDIRIEAEATRTRAGDDGDDSTANAPTANDAMPVTETIP